MAHCRQKAEFITLTSVYSLSYCDSKWHLVFSLKIQSSLFSATLKKRERETQLSFCGGTLLSNYCWFLKSRPLSVFKERLWSDNNFKLILKGMVRSILQKWRTRQLARTLKIHKINVYSLYKLKMKLYKDNVWVTTWIFLLHVLPDDDLIFGTK